MIFPPAARSMVSIGSTVSEPTPSPSLVRATLQVMLLLLGAALGLWVLYRVRSVLLLLVLAVFFAYLVAPLVRVLRRPISARGRRFVLPLPLAIGAIYVAIFGSPGGRRRPASSRPEPGNRGARQGDPELPRASGGPLARLASGLSDPGASRRIARGRRSSAASGSDRRRNVRDERPASANRRLADVPALADARSDSGVLPAQGRAAPAGSRFADSSPGTPPIARGRVPGRSQRNAGGLHSGPGHRLPSHRCGLHGRVPR